MYISRHGARKTDLKGDQPNTPEYTPLRLLLKQYGFNVLDNIDATDATAWTLPDPLEWVSFPCSFSLIFVCPTSYFIYNFP